MVSPDFNLEFFLHVESTQKKPELHPKVQGR
jgi:hypothetical protein